MSTASTITTRRSLLSGSTAIMAAALLATSTGTSARPTPRPSDRLRRAMDLHDRIESECERFDVETEMPARQACAAAIAAYQAEPPPPHEESATTFVNAFGDAVRLSTDRIGAGAVARKVVNDPTWADMGDDDWRQAHRELAAAHDRRDAVLAAQAKRKRDFEAATRARFRISEIADRSNTLADRRHRLWCAALATPAANLADVTTKLDFIARTVADSEVGHHELHAIADDVRRLAGEI